MMIWCYTLLIVNTKRRPLMTSVIFDCFPFHITYYNRSTSMKFFMQIRYIHTNEALKYIARNETKSEGNSVAA